MQSPDRRCVNAEMKIGSAASLRNRQILIDVGEGGRGLTGLRGFYGHGAVTWMFRRRRRPRKPKTLLPLPRLTRFARDAAHFFRDQTDDDRFEQCGRESQRANRQASAENSFALLYAALPF